MAYILIAFLVIYAIGLIFFAVCNAATHGDTPQKVRDRATEYSRKAARNG